MSKSGKIYDGITEAKDWLVEEARSHRFPNRKRRRTLAVAATAACLALALIASSLLPGGPMTMPAYAVAVPQYPEMVQYPGGEASGYALKQWRESVNEQYRDAGYADGLNGYFQSSIQQFLAENDGRNTAFSPLNVYMALAMLAEITDGTTRQQILDALGSEGMEALRQQANDLWNDTYRDDGMMQRVLASSIWLNEDIEFHQKTLDTLAENYYASSYQGQMGSAGLNQALRDWLNEQTGGLLKNQISGISLNEDTALALATTVYFKGKWTLGGFIESRTDTGIFHGAQSDAECDMMHASGNMNYYWGDKFTAVASGFESGEMRFLLPDEGYTPEELLFDSEALAFLSLERTNQWENSKYMKVHRTVPKFDIEHQTKLQAGLRALGITEVFSETNADFSAVTDQPLFLSQALHGVRVKIDERGCEAAAYTLMAADTSAAPAPEVEEIEFILDRPFLFVITNRVGLPLFVGIVNQL